MVCVSSELSLWQAVFDPVPKPLFILDDYGLLAAINWFVNRFMVRSPIRTRVIGSGLKQRLDPRRENAFFRITQETRANVARH